MGKNKLCGSSAAFRAESRTPRGDRYGAVGDIDAWWGAQAVERHHDLPPAVIGRRSQNQTGVGGLRREGEPATDAVPKHGRNLVGIGGPHHGCRLAAAIAGGSFIRRHARRRRQQAVRADDPQQRVVVFALEHEVSRSRR